MTALLNWENLTEKSLLPFLKVTTHSFRLASMLVSISRATKVLYFLFFISLRATMITSEKKKTPTGRFSSKHLAGPLAKINLSGFLLVWTKVNQSCEPVGVWIFSKPVEHAKDVLNKGHRQLVLLDQLLVFLQLLQGV